MASPHNVMRTVLISPQTDARLRSLAHRQNRSKNDIIRDFLEAGLAAADLKSGTPPHKRRHVKVSAGLRDG